MNAQDASLSPSARQIPPGTTLSEMLLCPACGNRLQFDASGIRSCCDLSGGSTLDKSIIRYEPTFDLAKSEVKARDNQASGYLRHGKFPTQISRIQAFVDRLSTRSDPAPVLDLGCGPGPTTKILVAAGYKVLGVDFSMRSLVLNAESVVPNSKVLFAHGDLTRMKFAQSCAGGLMMADFLQHLGNAGTQRSFLARAFAVLRPGGWFFLSFFNINVKHWLRGDIEGSYSDGAIPYRRLSVREVLEMFPRGVAVADVLPMNIFHSIALDRAVARLPFARLLARMIVITGWKR
jgi:SAM-dependent methyltransferase